MRLKRVGGYDDKNVTQGSNVAHRSGTYGTRLLLESF